MPKEPVKIRLGDKMENGVFVDEHVQLSYRIGAMTATLDGYCKLLTETQIDAPSYADWVSLKMYDIAEELSDTLRTYRDSMYEFRSHILNKIADSATDPGDDDDDDDPDDAARAEIAHEQSILARQARLMNAQYE